MAQSDGKVLVLGALAGVAGVGLAVMCYQGLKSKRRASWQGPYLNRTHEPAAGIMTVDGPCLSGGQVEVLQRLEALFQCVSELRDEMRALKTTLPTLQDQVREELRARDEARRASPLHRTTPTRKKRAAGTTTGATAEGRSSEDAESEGGYMTALTDSEEEEPSDEEQRHVEQTHQETTDEEPPPDKLSVLLEKIDSLHQGTDSDKRESLKITLDLKEEFGQNSMLLWRLVRAYCDVHDLCSTVDEKKTIAQTGIKVGEEAVSLNPTCAESHRWYAIICGIITEYDTVQNKIKYGFIFKDHLDKSIELQPHEPLSYYLLGRWCYSVAQMSWLERKVATALFGEPPSATLEDALRNFLKAEEIHPRYTKVNYIYLAKCYRDLGRRDNAKQMCEAANSMKNVSKEDEAGQKELEYLCSSLGV